MNNYEAFSTDQEILGQFIVAYYDATNSDHFNHFFERNNLGRINPDEWYPLQDLLNVFNDMVDDRSDMMDFISIGMNMAENADLPSDFDSMDVPELMKQAGNIFMSAFRGSDVGEIGVELVSDNHVKVHYVTPFPDDVVYGTLYGFLRRYSDNSSSIKAYYDPNLTRRDQGGEVTVIHAEWQ